MKKTEIALWNGNIPSLTDGASLPHLYRCEAENKTTGSTALILPGGAYSHCSTEHEGFMYAERLASLGMDSFVLTYRVLPARYPEPLLDSRRAMRVIRKNSKEFGIDKDRIAVMGSSAGGHLAALTATFEGVIPEECTDEIDSECPLPNMQILCYPVLDILGHSGSFGNLLGKELDKNRCFTPMYLLKSSSPAAFIWHTATDLCVNVGGTYRYLERLCELGISHEAHIYATGAHGLGLATDEAHSEPYITSWSDHLESWLRLKNWII